MSSKEQPAKLSPMTLAAGAWKALADGRDVLATLAFLGFVPALVALPWDPLWAEVLGLEGLAERAASWAALGFGWATTAYVASYWHRFLLLGRENIQATLPLWTRAETRLFWWYVGFGVLSWIAIFVLGVPLVLISLPLEGVKLAPWVLRLAGWVLVLGVSYLELRFCLAFPAAAVGGPARGFPDSWGATVGNGWRLVTATALALLPLAPPLVLTLHWLAADGVRQVAGAAFGPAVYLLMVVVFAGVLSQAYRHLVLSGGDVPDQAESEPDRPDPEAEAGARSLAPRARLFEEVPEEDEAPPAVRF